MKIRKFGKVGISLKALYEEQGSNLKHGKVIKTVEGEKEYYDLYDLSGEFCCSDGEVCEVVWEDDHGVRLLSDSGEYDTVFTLTKEEFEVGSLKN